MIWGCLGCSVFTPLKAAFSQQALPGTAQDTKKNHAAPGLETTPSIREELLLPLKQEGKSVPRHADVKVEGNDFVLSF